MQTLATRIRKRVARGPPHRSHVPRRPARDTTATWTAYCSRGAWTGTTATPTSARRRRGSATRSGPGVTGPSPDHAHAKFILLLSSHLETGHYFNPHAQRIIEGKIAGAKIATVDVRLSNTASMSDYWLAPYPGTEAALLLASRIFILEEDSFDREFLRRWVNWRGVPRARRLLRADVIDAFVAKLREEYARFTPEWVLQSAGRRGDVVRAVAREIGGGARCARLTCLAQRGLGQRRRLAGRALLAVPVRADGFGRDTKGGTALAATNKFVAAPFKKAAPQAVWNELLYPPEWPLAHHELSFLLPHLMLGSRQARHLLHPRLQPGLDQPRRVRVGRDAARTPNSGLPRRADADVERDGVVGRLRVADGAGDRASRPDEPGDARRKRWISFRQPVLRVAAERDGETSEWTWQANPGEVWEEDEFWIALSWEIDKDGSLGIRQYYESPYRPGERITDRGVLPLDLREQRPRAARRRRPGRADAARLHARRFGAFEVEARGLRDHEASLSSPACCEARAGDDGIWRSKKDGKAIGCRRRRPTSRRLQHAVEEARVLLRHDGGLGLTRSTCCRSTSRATSTTPRLDPAKNEFASCRPFVCRR